MVLEHIFAGCKAALGYRHQYVHGLWAQDRDEEENELPALTSLRNLRNENAVERYPVRAPDLQDLGEWIAVLCGELASWGGRMPR
ncbi:hypothetical protein ACIGXG_03590 [Streptomyces goshikiensis]|uniref:hypothetical protein n=1 Tax=Streptomyces goshikiensis TaxID=1942 RepID=UPI0037CD65FF